MAIFTTEIDNMLLAGAGILLGSLLPFIFVRMLKRMDDIVIALGELTKAVNNNHYEHSMQLTELGGRLRMVEKDTADIPKLWELSHAAKERVGVLESRLNKIIYPAEQ